MGLKTYIGVADCHGIESMTLKEDTTTQDIMHRMIRADANRQRHAVYYQVDLCDESYSMVNELLEKQDYTLALTWLKRLGHVMSPKTHAKSWELIPNSKLDPYG
jgi:hypothetical protein